LQLANHALLCGELVLVALHARRERVGCRPRVGHSRQLLCFPRLLGFQRCKRCLQRQRLLLDGVAYNVRLRVEDPL